MYFRYLKQFHSRSQNVSHARYYLWMKSLSGTVQAKATEQYFPVVLFIMLYKVGLTFESVDEILECDHSNESY